MKRFLTTLLLGFGLCQAQLSWGKASEFYNYKVLTTAPTVDARIFYNAGTINIDTIISSSPTNNVTSLYEYGANPIPYMTTGTLYFTNTSSGQMLGYPGFRFDTGTANSRHAAIAFQNFGYIEGLDTEGVPDFYATPGSTTASPVYNPSAPIASHIDVLANSIYNSGTLQVGNDGEITLTGRNITNYHGNLIAGQLATASEVNSADYNLTALEGLFSWDAIDGNYYYVPDINVYDLYWGITNNLTLDTSGFDFPNVPADIVTAARGDNIIPGFPINFDTSQYLAKAVIYIGAPSNIYYNVIFVNSNFANTTYNQGNARNITVTAGFTEPIYVQDVLTVPNNDGYGIEDIIQISEPVFDIITQTTNQNAIYVIDDSAVLPSARLSINDTTPEGMRPNGLAVITSTPPEWYDQDFFTPANGYETNIGYLSDLIYDQNALSGTKEPLTISEYGAQIGYNPSSITGSFANMVNPGTDAGILLPYMNVNLPDPTNLPARVELNAANLDLTMARIRAEGMVEINATNLGGSNTTGTDWGVANATIGATNGMLTNANFFPVTFNRIRGDVYVWSANWQNQQTNFFSAIGQDPTQLTNTWHYHITVVDQNLFGSFPSTIRNLNLTGKKLATISDNLSVIGNTLITTPNLLITSTNFTNSQNAQNFVAANAPNLKNLVVQTNAVFAVENTLDIGFNPNAGQSGPVGRRYTVDTVTNYGQITAYVPQIQARTVEQDGIITANNTGSVAIQASNIFMGVATGSPNSIFAGSDVYLSAMNIEATGSTIQAGLGGSGTLTIYAENHLSDLFSGTPTAIRNTTYSNQWSVSNGFNLPVKPATGDLFGTQIYTYAGSNQLIDHVWAGEDRGASPLGFTNNATIGRLVLDRATNGTLHFTGAGARNAMYVDYLELTNIAYTNYRNGILIDPNMTIYFADSNGDPNKLTNTVSGLVWVPNFVGPNSVLAIPYYNSSIVCLMNEAVAHSVDISFWPSYGANSTVLMLNGVPGAPSPYPYLLNNPGNLSSYIPCPGDYTFPCNCTPGSNQISYLVGPSSSSLDVLTISQRGLGTITPTPATNAVILGDSYTLTAKPAKGWLFASWVVSEQGIGVTNYDPTVTFDFVTNTDAAATFVPNPFPSLEGAYTGLFYATNGVVDPDSSGLVKLSVSSSGAFSGKLQMGAETYTFNSKFNGAGIATANAKGHAGTLALYLLLDPSGTSGQINGTVTGSSFTASLSADFGPVYTGSNPSPYAGSFVTALPWDTGTDSTNETGGDSWGVGTVTKAGELTLAGSLADGSHFSSSAPVSKYGAWPFYVYSSSSKDIVLGWAAVSNGINSTNIAWVKPANVTRLYPNGFETILQTTNSPWQTLTANSHPFVDTNILMTLSGGDLAAPITNTLGTKNFITYTGSKSSVTIGSSGSFTGWFTDPASNKKVSISGVVLTDISTGSIGRGYFLGTDSSGTVLLQNR